MCRDRSSPPRTARHLSCNRRRSALTCGSSGRCSPIASPSLIESRASGRHQQQRAFTSRVTRPIGTRCFHLGEGLAEVMARSTSGLHQSRHATDRHPVLPPRRRTRRGDGSIDVRPSPAASRARSAACISSPRRTRGDGCATDIRPSPAASHVRSVACFSSPRRTRGDGCAIDVRPSPAASHVRSAPIRPPESNRPQGTWPSAGGRTCRG